MKTILLAGILFGQFAMATSPVQTIPRPVMPNYEQCAPRDSGCESRNRAARDNYNNEVRGYNEAMRVQNDLNRQQQLIDAANAENTAATAQVISTQSTRENLQHAIQENKKGKNTYQKASLACAVISAGAMVVYAASMGTNKPALYTSIAFGAFSALASMQSKSHAKTAQSACVSSNQISTTQQNCDAFVNNPNVTGTTTTGGTTWPQGSAEVLPLLPDGTCTGTAEECQTIVDNLPPGTNLRDLATGISGFARNGRDMFSVDPNTGVVTMKDGKKIDPSVFRDAKRMSSELGMSPAAAQSLLADLNKNSVAGTVAGLGSDKKSGSSKDSGISAGSSIGGTAGMTIGVQGENKNGELANPDGNAVAGTGNGSTEGVNRGYASAEGLVKDFNGEMIGVAGDDIFKMMNRRYNLKATQDTFIGP